MDFTADHPLGCVANRLLQEEEIARFGASVGRIDQDRAGTQQVLVLLED